VRLVAIQLLVVDYIFRHVFEWRHCISTPDDHFTADPDCRVIESRIGRTMVLVSVQVSLLGLICAGFERVMLVPPQTIISLPVHTAV